MGPVEGQGGISKYVMKLRYKIYTFLPETCDFPLAPLLEDPSVSDENDDSEAAIVAIFYIKRSRQIATSLWSHNNQKLFFHRKI